LAIVSRLPCGLTSRWWSSNRRLAASRLFLWDRSERNCQRAPCLMTADTTSPSHPTPHDLALAERLRDKERYSPLRECHTSLSDTPSLSSTPPPQSCRLPAARTSRPKRTPTRGSCCQPR